MARHLGDPMETTTRHGGCHCGKVRWSLSAPVERGITCNCSICQKTGTVLSFVPAEAFVLEQGEDALTDYQFNRKIIHHYFCSTCGIRSFARGVGQDGKVMVAVNLRCIDDIDLAAVATVAYDGKSR